MKILTIAAILILIIVVVIISADKKSSPNPDISEKVKVVTSFYPLYFFTSQIGGEHVEITNLTPAGAEPHDYEPSTGDVVEIMNSQLLIANGAGFEPWLDRLQIDFQSNNVKVLETAAELSNQNFEEGDQIRVDPHVWLDPLLAKQEVLIITKALISVDPENKLSYEQNSRQLQNQLDNLDQLYRQGLADCKQHDIVTSHTAFTYLARRYGLKQIAISGISPEDEPSPARLAQVAEFAKQNDVQYIFFETLLSPRLAETIAKEAGVRALVLDPIEGLSPEDEAAGSNYISIQQKNLNTLQLALQCN